MIYIFGVLFFDRHLLQSVLSHLLRLTYLTSSFRFAHVGGPAFDSIPRLNLRADRQEPLSSADVSVPRLAGFSKKKKNFPGFPVSTCVVDASLTCFHT